MTKQYTTPQLTVHGNVESITQFGGGSDRNDFLFFSGGSVSSHGSTNQKVIATQACQGGSCNL
jgi:hypothetical protein